MGYATYRRSKVDPPAGKPLLTQGEDPMTFETPEFMVTIARGTGGIIRLFDRTLKHEFVTPSGQYGLNDYLYVTGGDGTGMIHPGGRAPALEVKDDAVAKAKIIANGPLTAVVEIDRSFGGPSPIDTYLIFGPGRRLDIINYIHKEATTEKEAGYFAFPFQLDSPGSAYIELPFGWLEAEKEQLPGACRDWYSAVSYAAVSDGAFTAYLATPDAPLVTVNDIFRGKWIQKLGPANGTLFSYALNNYWHTNYKASQGGDLVFAYSLDFAKGPFDPVHATRFGWDRLAVIGRHASAEPAVGAVWAVHAGERAGSRSLLRLGKGPVVIGGLTWERGKLVVRLYNPSRKAASTTLSYPPGRIKDAAQTDLAGRHPKPLMVVNGAASIRVPARGIATVELSVLNAATRAAKNGRGTR
jgi:hypothetical protein